MKFNTRTLTSIALVLAVVLSAFSLISVRQLNRLAFYDVQKLESERDDLSIEWRQLMAEFSTWRLEHNVESEVRGEHNMEPPDSGRIQTIYLAVDEAAK